MTDVPATHSPRRRETRAVRGRFLLALGVVVGIVVLLAIRQLPPGDYLRMFFDWVRDLGAIGYAVFVVGFIVAALFFLPGTVLAVGAGAVFGLVGGFVIVSLGRTIGAACAFLIGRYYARESVARRMAKYPRYTAIDRAVGREGFRIVLLTRLSPLFPYNFQNYAYGLTTVRFRDFVLGSWVGMAPAAALYVYIGGAAGELAGAGPGDGGPLMLALKIGGLIATIAIMVYVTRFSRRALRSMTDLEDKRVDGEGTPS